MKIPKNLTKEQFEEHLNNTYKNIILLDEYITGSDKVTVKCKLDDYEWKVFPRNVYTGDNMECSECNRRKANMGIRKRFNQEYPTLRIVTPDIFSNPKTVIRCQNCGDSFEVYRKHFIGNNITNFKEEVNINDIVFFKDKKKDLECVSCLINNVKEEFEKVVADRECTIVGEYTNNTTPVTIKCNNCGSEFGVVPNYYIDKVVSKCKYCKNEQIGGKAWVSVKEIDWI